MESLLVMGGITVEVVRKRVKHVNFTVYPPEGRVRVSAPHRLTEDELHRTVAGRLEWIRRQQANVRTAPQPRHDAHLVFGRMVPLDLIGGARRTVVSGESDGRLTIFSRDGATRDEIERALAAWDRDRLETLLAGLIAAWQEKIGAVAAGWQVRAMTTRWGSCSPQTGRLRFSLDLAAQPVEAVEYVVVHELVHLVEHRHGRRFERLMDRHLPDWRRLRSDLNRGHSAAC